MTKTNACIFLTVWLALLVVAYDDAKGGSPEGADHAENPALVEADFQAGLDAYERGDFETAMEEWRLLAQQGDADAQKFLGAMYTLGRGVPRDFVEAAKWIRLAAEQGDAGAQYNLGVMYADGRGVPQDFVEAAKWIRLAAEQGNAGAQVNLGFMYSQGQGVPQDYVEAAKWIRLAAEQGDVGAQVNLGRMYFEGLGVPQDFVLALMWINLAAAQGSETAIELRKVLGERMTDEQLAEGQRLAREWEAKEK